MEDVTIDEDDMCEGHLALDGVTLLPCGLPVGHRRVPEEAHD